MMVAVLLMMKMAMEMEIVRRAMATIIKLLSIINLAGDGGASIP